jgi:hypothetical protein
VVQHLQLVCELPSGLLECNLSGRAAWRVWRRPRPLDTLLQQTGGGL